MFSNPISAYQKVSLESDVLGADPHRLIILLFDAAEAALEQAQVHLAEKNLEAKSRALGKAMEIITDGLVSSLNIEKGGELAQNLQALYLYMVSRLMHAHRHNDPVAVSEVQKLLGEISGAWREMGTTLKNDSAGTQNL